MVWCIGGKEAKFGLNFINKGSNGFFREMKKGIDAKWFFEGPVSNRLVVQKMVQHIIAANKGNQLAFFAAKILRPTPGTMSQKKKIKYEWSRT